MSEQSEFQELAKITLEEVEPGADATGLDVGLRLIRAGNRLQNDLEVQVNRPLGVTWAAFRVLFTLRTVGPVSPKRLSHLSNTSAASISSVLNTLDRYRLIERTPDPKDGRSVTIGLNEAGTTKVAELISTNNSRMNRWTSVFDEQELEVFVGLLERILSARVPSISGEDD